MKKVFTIQDLPRFELTLGSVELFQAFHYWALWKDLDSSGNHITMRVCCCLFGEFEGEMLNSPTFCRYFICGPTGFVR